MKKILKLSVCALSLVAGTTASFLAPTLKSVNAVSKGFNTVSGVKSATGRTTVAFNITKMPTKVVAEGDTEKENFFIPTPKVSADCTLKIVVKSGSKTYEQVVDDADATGFAKKSDGSGYFFKAYKADTTYKVYFVAEIDGSAYSSSIYTVSVDPVGYVLETDVADNCIVDIMGIGDKIALPSMAITGTDVTVAPKVFMNNTLVTLDSTNTTGDFRYDSANGIYYLIPSVEGLYTVEYSSSTYGLNKSYSINVSAGFDSSKVELKANTLTKSACEVGEEITLPKPTVTDSFHAGRKTNFSVVISIYKNDSLVATLPENTYKYTFKETGNYVVKYSIKNYYLNNQKTLDVQIGEEVVVEHTKKPTVYFAKDYNTTVEGWEDNIEILGDYAVNSVTGYNGIDLPAIYASDLSTNYDGLKGSFERLLVCGSKTYNIDKASDNASLSEDNTDLTKAINFKFKDTGDSDFAKNISGTYTLKYIAKDSAGTTTKTLTIKVEAIDTIEANRNTHLSINLPTSINNEMKSDSKLTVSVDDAKDDQDTRIETHYYYYYGNDSLTFTANEGVYYNFSEQKPANFVELECEDSKLTIELKDYEDQTDPKPTTVTVVAVAINDQGQFVYDTKEISIKNVSDTAVPVATKVSDYEKSIFVAGQEDVVLPQIQFSDLSDKKLEISVGYYIDSIDNYLSSGKLGSEGLTTAVIRVADAEIITGKITRPSKAGVYYVVYTARDDANNIYELITSFEVKKEKSYTLNVTGYDSAVDVYGTSTVLAEVLDAEGNVVDADYTVEFVSNSPSSQEGNICTFNEVGDYQFVVKSTVYKPLVAEPDDFGTNYANYYKKVGNEYVVLSSTETFVSEEFYSRLELESNICSIKVSDVDYVWDADYDKKYAPVSNAQLSPSEYTVLTSKPSDWETNYASYYTKDGSNYELNTEAEWSNTKTYYKKNELVYVTLTPPIARQNGHQLDVKITVTDPNGDEVETIAVEDAVNAGTVKFLANKEGQYKVVFSAGEGDKKITKTYTVQIGDGNKPNLTIDKTKLTEDIIFDGRDIKYEIVKHVLNEEKSSSSVNVYNVTIKASYVDKDNNAEEIFTYDVEMNLYDIDRNNVKIALDWDTAFNKGYIKLNGNTATSNSWTISKVGENELTISVSDKFKNMSEVYSIKFNVVEKPAVKEKKDNKVGIILIVISIIVLVGLVGFFAFAGKSKTKKSKTSKKVEKVEDKKEEDKQ